MIDIDPRKTKLLLLTIDEVFSLKDEIQQLFCVADETHSPSCYSGVEMAKRYPKVSEIFNKLKC